MSMEHESHAPQRPVAEGLHLPKGTLEAGLGRSEKDDKDGKDSKSAGKSERGTRFLPSSDKPPVAHVALGGEISGPGVRRGTEARTSDAVAAWQRLTNAERPIAPVKQEMAAAVLAAEAAGQREVDDDDEDAEADDRPAEARRMAEDAMPLEGNGEIPLQAAAPDTVAEPPEHLDNVLPFPMERIQAVTEVETVNETAVAEVTDINTYRQQQQERHAAVEQPPDMPPPLGPWMDSEHPRWPSTETADDDRSNVLQFPTPAGPPPGNGGSGGSGSNGGGEGGGYGPASEARRRSELAPAEVTPVGPAMPIGSERTSADVRKAAGTGLLLGYVAGRFGKNRAVKRAVEAATKRFQRKQRPRPLPSAARYDERAAMPSVANIVPLAAAAAVGAERPGTAARTEAVREQTKPRTEWLRSETVAPQTPPAERLALQPLAELLAAPAAAVALKSVSLRPAAERLSATPGAASEAALNKSQLLEMARTIKVEGVPLRDIYESKQIDDDGLRAVVEAYLRGGDVSQQVQKEVVEKQKQFERDPFNRKRSRGQLRDTLSGVSSKVIDATGSMAKTAGDVVGKAGKSLAGGAKQAQQKVTDGSETQQWAGIGAVVVIWAIILFLVIG